MEKGNVLVIGNSGVGKSTLINAVLKEDVAATGWGTSGTTQELKLYESNDPGFPFRIIDTIGFEPNRRRRREAIHAIKEWSKECTKEGKENQQINVIWFCIDGTRSKVFEEDIESFAGAVSIWKGVPVIVAITKSYSEPERQNSIAMVDQAFAHTKKKVKIQAVVPVVAQEYVINDGAVAPPFGIAEIISKTNDLMPEGMAAAQEDLSKFILNRKNALAHSVVGTLTAGAAAVGAVPIPFSDAAILMPIEISEVNTIAKIYGIDKYPESKPFIDLIVQSGTVGAGAKALISATKAIPGVNLATSVINAVTAGMIVALLGEGAVYVYEQVYLGKRDISDLDWVKKFMENKFAASVIGRVEPVLKELSNSSSKQDILKAVQELIKPEKEKEGSESKPF